MKRSLDISLSLLAIIILAPFLAILAVSVRSSSPGPVLFRQKRVGYGGREFEMLKFRSMVVNAEELLPSFRHSRTTATR